VLDNEFARFRFRSAKGRGGEGDRKAVTILFQWNFEIGPLGYDTEIVFILGFRAVLIM